jgi:hypothetical protein
MLKLHERVEKEDLMLQSWREKKQQCKASKETG